MPKRVIDFDALWASDKLAACAAWAQAEYAWLYGLADASGSFELTNLRVIWGRVAAIRKNHSLERLEEIFAEFIARGLLFTWEENGKRYGHWTGSDVPGRLPAPSWRVRLEKLAPPVPADALAAYSARFGGSKEGIVARAASQQACATDAHTSDAKLKDMLETPQACLKGELEAAQAQDLDWDRDLDLDWKKEEVCRSAQPARIDEATPEALLEIYEAERGPLPAAGDMTGERRRRCKRWLAAGFSADDFRAAVRRAAATPFLAGEGDRGWRANFDWLIANRSNARKVLAGEYAPAARRACRAGRAERRGPADLYAGMAPRPADCGVRVNPAALARIRAREAQVSLCNSRTRGSAPALHAMESRAPAAPDFLPQPLSNNAQPRASPAALK